MGHGDSAIKRSYMPSDAVTRDSDSAFQQVSAGDRASDLAAWDSRPAIQGPMISDAVIQRKRPGAAGAAGTASADGGGWRLDRGGALY